MRQNIRVLIVIVVLAVVMAVAAFPNLVPPGLMFWRDDGSSPKALACREEAIKKYPNDMQTIGSTPDGTSKIVVNRNANAFSEAYSACLKR